MGYSEREKECIEYTFHAFCKTVLRNEAINAYRELQRKQKHEVSLDYPNRGVPFCYYISF